MARVTEDAVREQLRGLHGWTRDGDVIRKEFTFESFPDAVAFLVRLAFEAEAADHHPDVSLSYRRVTVIYTTHSEGGLTTKDFDGARAAERLVTGSDTSARRP